MIVELKGHIRPHCFKLHSYAHKKFFEKDVEKNGFFFDKLAIRSRTFKKDLNEGNKQPPFWQVSKISKESQRSKILPGRGSKKIKTRTI